MTAFHKKPLVYLRTTWLAERITLRGIPKNWLVRVAGSSGKSWKMSMSTVSLFSTLEKSERQTLVTPRTWEANGNDSWLTRHLYNPSWAWICLEFPHPDSSSGSSICRPFPERRSTALFGTKFLNTKHERKFFLVNLNSHFYNIATSKGNKAFRTWKRCTKWCHVATTK